MTSRGRINKSLNPDYVRGILTAADFADDYNGSSLHRYMLGDCIALKFNVVSRKRPRPNPKAARNNNLWLAGYVTALVTVLDPSGDAAEIDAALARRLFSLDEALAPDVPLTPETRALLEVTARRFHPKRPKTAARKRTRRTRP